MIGEALNFVKKTLDQRLMNQFGLDEGVVVLNNLVQQDGAVSQKNQNKIVITMINLESETAKQYYGGQIRSSDDSVANRNPTARFNLVLLFSANFDDYEECLKFINATIALFQAHETFTTQSAPGLPQGIDKLEFEYQNLDFHQTHNLWNSMGAKYLPSLIYKVRHVGVQANQTQFTVPVVIDPQSLVSEL